MTMEPPQVQAHVRLAKAGRPEGFGALLAAYGPRLYGYFFRITADRHDAEDLLSEVMLRLVRTIGRYDERGRFEPWLFRIAANLVRDRFRRRAAAVAALGQACSKDADDPVDSVAGREEPPDSQARQEEERHGLMAALNSLDEPTRQTIVLRHFSGMSFAEIADVMGCPVGTALARVHRGLRALRARLEGSPDRNRVAAADSFDGSGTKHYERRSQKTHG